MRKVLVVALAVLFAAVALAAPQTMAGQGKEKKAEAKKPEQWGGLIVGMNKEKSTLSVSQMGFTKTVVYDSSTKWFKDNGKKPADASAVREDIEVSCVGTYDKKGRLIATQIILVTR